MDLNPEWGGSKKTFYVQEMCSGEMANIRRNIE
jgi:hypothetical protein